MTNMSSDSMIVVAALSLLSVMGISSVYQGDKARLIALNFLIVSILFVGAATFSAINGYGLDRVYSRYIGEPVASIFGWKTKTPEEFGRESMKELENQKLQAERRLQQALERSLSDLEAQRVENQKAIEDAQKRVAEAQAAKEKATQRAERYEIERREAEAQRSRDRLTREKPQVTYPLGPSGPPMIPFR